MVGAPCRDSKTVSLFPSVDENNAREHVIITGINNHKKQTNKDSTIVIGSLLFRVFLQPPALECATKLGRLLPALCHSVFELDFWTPYSSTARKGRGIIRDSGQGLRVES